MRPRGRTGTARGLKAEADELRRQFPEVGVELVGDSLGFTLRLSRIEALADEARGRELAYALTWLTVAYRNLGWCTA